MHPLLRARAGRHFGVFTARDAVLAGYTHEQVQAEVTRGRWLRLRRGAYADRDTVEAARASPADWHRLLCAAVLIRLGGGPAISHASAARLLGIPVPAASDERVRLTDPAQWRRGRDYDVSRATLSAHHLTPLGPFTMTAPARTLVDCGREWELEDSVIAMDAALHSGRLTVDELRAAVLEQTHWLGIGAAARAANLADPRSESPLETLGRLKIIGSGLPTPELQVEIHDSRGLVARIDAWYEEAAVAVEFDGLVKYEDPWDGRTPGRVLWDEKRREDRVRDLDIRVIRLARPDIGPGWPRVEARLRSLIALPMTRPRRFHVIRTGLPRTHTA